MKTFEWTVSLRPKAAKLFSNRAFEVAVGSAIALAGLASFFGSLASLREFDPHIAWFFLPFLCLGATIAVLEKSRRVITRRARQAHEHYEVRVGLDGLEANGRYMAWSDVAALHAPNRGQEQHDLIVTMKDNERTVLLDCPPELLSMTESHYRMFLELPEEPSERAANADAMHYRTSTRPALVRVASNAKVPPSERLRAAKALMSEGPLGEEVEASFTESLDPAIQAFLKR